jgi:hemolysin activation/secretion protein
MEKFFPQHPLIAISSFSLAYLTLFPLSAWGQNSPSELESLPDLDRTIPRQPESLPTQPPKTPQKPKLRTPQSSDLDRCQISTELNQPYSNYKDRFLIKDIQVTGSTVLQPEIKKIIKNSKLKYRTATFEDVVCLRSRITALYLQNGYVTSGAFLVNNQDLSQGIVQIQVVEGELEDIQITGLSHLTENYVRSRINLATTTPLNQKSLETALQLLILNPIIATVSAELTAGKRAGSNILLLDIQEADAFSTNLVLNNYRAPSIGEIQGSVNIAHNNLFGFGDRLQGNYDFTEGLDLYNFSYTIPWNSYDGTLGFSYDNGDSEIIEEQFRDFDIESETKTISFNLRQPLLRSPNQEFTLSFDLDLRRRRTFLQGEPFAFPLGGEDGESNATVLRFSQDWVNRNAKRVLAARSQFNLGIDAFDATISNTEPDGRFFAWQGQFQWVQQLSARNLLIARIGGQFTPNPLLSLEQFSLGGVNTVRGYQENQLITDSGILGSIEFRIPLTKNPNTLQLTPFFDFGTGWNHEEPESDPATLASLGLELNYSVASQLNLNLNYGIPLIAVDDEGDSIQENGVHFSLSYQPF